MKKITCITHPDFSVDAIKRNAPLIESHKLLLHYANEPNENVFRMD